jgi:predicted nucleotidyltransferase
MGKINTKELDKVIENLKKQDNVLGIILFGSLIKGNFDKYSDVDLYIIFKKREKYCRKNLKVSNFRLDILMDTYDDIKKYLADEKFNIRRNVSCMLAEGEIVFARNHNIKNLVKISKINLKNKTKYTSSELLMNKYSIDDYFSAVKRSYYNNDFIGFSFNSQFLIDNIIELFLKIKGLYYLPPDRMADLFSNVDRLFFKLIRSYFLSNSNQIKFKILFKLVKYIYKISKGPLPDKFFIWS